MTLLLQDRYHGNGDIPVTALANDPDCAGVIVKVFEGESYDTSWFLTWWPQLLKALDDGKFEAVGAYDWVLFHEDGAQQFADAKAVVDRFGGWERRGVLPPIADIERGDQHTPIIASRVLASCKAWTAAAAKAGFTRRIQYGRSLQRDLGISDHMGFTDLWTPRYNGNNWTGWQTWLGEPPLPGWHLSDVRLWQGTNGREGPVTTLGGQKLDTSLWTGSLDELHAFAGLTNPGGGDDDMTDDQIAQALGFADAGSAKQRMAFMKGQDDAAKTPPVNTPPADPKQAAEYARGHALATNALAGGGGGLPEHTHDTEGKTGGVSA